MLLMCFALLGAAASRAVRLPGLLLIVSILAISIGLEGAVNHRAFVLVLLNAVLMLVTVESAYFAAMVLGGRSAGLLSHWKA